MRILNAMQLLKMKNLHNYLVIIIIGFLFSGCSKTVEPTENKANRVANFLAGNGVGVRSWHLDKIFINDVPQKLTDIQKSYVKIYAADPSNTGTENPKTGTFKNEEGFNGNWRLNDSNEDFLSETYTDSLGISISSIYLINSISLTILDIENTVNYKTVRKQYYAY